ncbi:battenin CLN3 protein [Collariella sp. IMI 366227]|nr:battenin CLN3 protein [Collariella sp. IMI 366227]
MNRPASASGGTAPPSCLLSHMRTRLASIFQGADPSILIAFWLFGLINNILYVLLLTAAQDLVGPSLPKGIVLLADVKTSFWGNVRRARALFFPYMLPLLLVYVAEYTINQGVAPTLLFPLAESPFSEFRAFYPFYGFLYQLGVFISRSSTPFIRIHHLYLPSLLQVANLVLLTLHALLTFIPSVYLVFVVIFWEGLLGGAVYVNTFAEIMENVPAQDREFSLGATSVSDSGGICIAGFLGMALEVWLCRWQVAHGRDYCRRIELAYCPTRLAYSLEKRRIATGELIEAQSSASVEDAQETFDAGVKAWDGSEECKTLLAFLDNTPLPKVTNVVAFACSTISGERDRRLRAIYQHAPALILREFFNDRRERGQPEVKILAQDSIYCKTDVATLQRVGITVLGDPEVFLEVDDESVVISFYPNVPTRQIIADIIKPAIMIWNWVSSEAEAAERCGD